MSDDVILIERRGAVALLTINRPKTLNALDMATLAVLDEKITELERDDSVRAIIITGAGKSFVAGGDIADLNARRGLPHYMELAERLHKVLRHIETIDKPTIAAVNGWALGGGTELLLCTDIRIAGKSAKFGLPEITLGLFPGAGGTQRLTRQIPLCKAKAMMFFGEHIAAGDAERLGLINEGVEDSDLMARAFERAEAIASKSPLVLKLLKRTLLDGDEMPLGAALRHEQAMISIVLDSDDAHEGCTAFLEKRKAVFKGV